jgi:Tol biopolymer transport system component
MSTVSQLNAALAGRYVIERELGAGGMATVYLARDVRHDRDVAIKVLHPDLGAALGGERFLAEIKTTAKLQHPHILSLLDSGDADGLLYYVMPVVTGESLRDRMTRERQLPIAEAVRIAREVAGALDYAHRHGVIHRDIKPENILLHDGSAIVADFGIALAVQSASGPRMTQTGLSLGTPQYMSPEQAMGERQIDARADIYALGAVTYEMLTGDPPFTGSSVQAIVARVMTERPTAPHVLRDTIPPHVEQAVLTALEKLPADRFATASGFADALQTPSLNAPVAVIPRKRARGLTWATIAPAAAVGFLVATAVRPSRTSGTDSTDGNTVRFAFPPPEGVHFTGDIPPFALSPDGQAIAFRVTATDGRANLYLHRLNEVESRRIPGVTGGSHPFFSGDGKWIGYFEGLKYFKVPTAGGSPLALASVPVYSGAAWLKEDIVIGSSGGAGSATYGLHLLPASGGPPRPLTKVDSAHGESAHLYPRVLEDGRTILFTSYRGIGGSESRIGVASGVDGATTILDLPGSYALGVTDGQLIYGNAAGQLMAVPFDVAKRRITGTPRLLLEGVVASSQAVAADMSPNGTLMYAVGTHLGQLVLADSRNALTPASDSLREYRTPRFSPDGRRIAVMVRSEGIDDIWLYDISSHTFSRFTSGGLGSRYPEWGPDGKSIVFVSTRDRKASLWRQAVDGGRPELVEADGADGAFASSGRAITFVRGGALWVRSLGADTSTKQLAMNAVRPGQARVSPDGHWLAYTSEETGAYQIYVTPFPGPGPATPVSVGGGLGAVWTRDGRRLLYQVGGRFVIAATFKTSPAFTVTARDTIYRGNFTPFRPHADYDVSPDGSHLLLVNPSSDGQWMVVLNWRAELRKSLGAR